MRLLTNRSALREPERLSVCAKSQSGAEFRDKYSVRLDLTPRPTAILDIGHVEMTQIFCESTKAAPPNLERWALGVCGVSRYKIFAIFGGKSQSSRPFISFSSKSTSATPPFDILQSPPVRAPITSLKLGS